MDDSRPAEAAAAVGAFIESSSSDKEASMSEEELRRVIAEAIEPHLRAFGRPPTAPRPAQRKSVGSSGTPD